MKLHTPNRITLSTATTLTGSYVTQHSDIQAGHGRDQLVIEAVYSKGDETSCEIKVQFSPTVDFSTAFEQTVAANSSGEYTLSPINYKLTASGNLLIPITNYGYYWRVQAKATGGTPTGTLALTARMDVLNK